MKGKPKMNAIMFNMKSYLHSELSLSLYLESEEETLFVLHTDIGGINNSVNTFI